jgi:hypothetical protein
VGLIYATWLNTSIDDSSVRATVISMTNLGDSAGEWGGGPALGVVGNVFGFVPPSRRRGCLARRSSSTPRAAASGSSPSSPQACGAR